MPKRHETAPYTSVGTLLMLRSILRAVHIILALALMVAGASMTTMAVTASSTDFTLLWVGVGFLVGSIVYLGLSLPLNEVLIGMAIDLKAIRLSEEE